MNISRLSSSDVSYKNRGEYCEGLFIQGFSIHDEVRLLGFHASSFELDASSGSTVSVRIHSNSLASGKLFIRDLVPSKFYQLDKSFSADQREFDWNLNLISDPRVNLDINDLSALACVPDCEASNRRLLPVEISARGRLDKVVFPHVLYQLPLSTQRVQITMTDPNGEQELEVIDLKGNALFPSIVQQLDLKLPDDLKAVKLEIVAFSRTGSPSYTSAILELIH